MSRRYRGQVLTLLLTRHGHTNRSEPEQYLGQHVAATLSERGHRAAEALAERLRDVPIDRVISSPLERALDTGQVIAAATENEAESDDRLLELDYGAWEGLTVEEIDRRFPGERELYDANPALHRVGGGETGLQVAARLAPLIDELLTWSSGGREAANCLLVGHSSVNRILLATLLGVPMEDYRRRFRQDWANLTVLRWSDPESGPMLLLCNDVSHVRGVVGATWD